MKRTEIEGSKVIHEFVILREGWEMDNYGWVTEDKKIFSTNHGVLVEMDREELWDLIQSANKMLYGMHAAMSYTSLAWPSTPK